VFVNGIPLAVIEAKKPGGHGKKGPTIDEGISQSIRNQLNDEIPQLFVYSQLLLSINGHDGLRYLPYANEILGGMARRRYYRRADVCAAQPSVID
jgi:type I site-specific restriction-modification system R (restriction) subunit